MKEGLEASGLKDFVGALARKHHLDAHGFDDARQQVHRRRCPHGGHVVRLDEVDHVAQGVQTLLNGIVDFVVHGADPVGHLAGRREVGGAFESDGEGV